MTASQHSGCDCGCQSNPAAACGCCEGIATSVPQPTMNRPGLTGLTYRIGTHASFLASLKARLSSHVLPQDDGSPSGPLTTLATRAADDPAIALLDGWATVADVLTFYQERIVNEGYLRTATEQRSVLSLAALVGYAPRPGLAASAFLAYDVDENTTVPVTIPAAARVQSVPGPDEQPQIFETSEPLVAAAAWNRLSPRMTLPQQLGEVLATGELYLKGISTNLKPGDPILIGSRGDPDLFRILAVDVQSAADRTRIRFEPWVPGRGDADGQDGGPEARRGGLLDPNWIANLGKKPSQPLRSSRQLRGNLKQSFRLGSDAALQMLRRASPELGQSLGAALDQPVTPEPDLAVVALRLKAGVFGRNAPERRGYRSASPGMEFSVEPLVYEPIGEWPIVTHDVQHESEQTVFLDGAHETLLPNSWIVFDFSAVPPLDPMQVQPVPFGEGRPYTIMRIRQVSPKIARSAYGINGDTARLELERPWIAIHPADATQQHHNNDFQVIRGTAIYAQSEPLDLAEAPIGDPICGGAASHEPLEFSGLLLGLEPGRYVIVSGQRTDLEATGVAVAEAAMIAEVVHGVRSEEGLWPTVPAESDGSDVPTDNHLAAPADGQAGQAVTDRPQHGDTVHTFVRLERPLAYCYRREGVSIYGNVVKATHGETRAETLGSGDGAKPLQAFTLKQPPLTYLAAPTAAGSESTLQVFVNDIRWKEVPSFIDRAPGERVFVTGRNDAGLTTITFGDGTEGTRLPTGLGNVQAIYRSGLGREGNVRAGQLTTLQTRPQGVKEVRNPLRASGGAVAESRDVTRQNAPLGVRALDRLISVADHADFARAFAGIGKAAAVRLSDGVRSVVHVTIAGIDDAPIDPSSDLFLNLRRALCDLGDPLTPIVLAPRLALALMIEAGIRIHPDHRWERVVGETREALLDSFGFARRDLAQDVAASEVIAAMQAVTGVLYVDLDHFGAVPLDQPDSNGSRPSTPEEVADAVAEIATSAPSHRVLSEPARPVRNSHLLPAQLAILVPEIPATLVLNQIMD